MTGRQQPGCEDASELSGKLALGLGLVALFLTSGFVYLNGGFTPTGPRIALDWGPGRWIGYLGFALVFRLGTPLICGVALLLSLPARDLWTARIAIATVTVSLALYGLTIQACAQLV